MVLSSKECELQLNKPMANSTQQQGSGGGGKAWREMLCQDYDMINGKESRVSIYLLMEYDLLEFKSRGGSWL
ncbi:hypothetical protein SLEP1_g14920 [Rubroshorea leprosula]|uniref:Uncharacterized protein n=1 Tax=Rubroshorea leprosula TaxID=152421 RepID=A0AAV5IUR0_9ROSI|nr:hypothetical protein SLEP1_g14920 [Rubroshorea leprosula]